MTELSLSTQAKLLSRYLKEKGLANISHTQALEAVAHALNFKSFNEAQAMRRGSTQGEALTLLAQAKEKGLTRADAEQFFAGFRTADELAFVTAAELWNQEGELEHEENAAVSMAGAGSDTGGAYVQMWKWVPVEDIPMPSDLLDALRLPWGVLGVHIGDLDLEINFSDLKLNERAIAQLRAGISVPDDVWLVKRRTKDQKVLIVLNVRDYKALVFNAKNDYWEGCIEGQDWLIEMSRR